MSLALHHFVQIHESSIVTPLVTRTGMRVRWHSVTTEMNIHGWRQNHALSEFIVSVCNVGYLEEELCFLFVQCKDQSQFSPKIYSFVQRLHTIKRNRRSCKTKH